MIKRDDHRTWYQGPQFTYKGSAKITVNVTRSSWTIRGLPEAEAVIKVLRKHKQRGGALLDFGAGSWLRYTKRIRRILPTHEIFVVEFDEAFHDEATIGREEVQTYATLWRPIEFVQEKKRRFDLALLVNVLNTIPEESHRRSIFATVAERLNPLGWLVVYQRIWVTSENPPDAIPYDDGWLIPQPNYKCHTYRVGTGARWFNEQARTSKLRPVETGVEISSSNTLLRVWEKPF